MFSWSTCSDQERCNLKLVTYHTCKALNNFRNCLTSVTLCQAIMCHSRVSLICVLIALCWSHKKVSSFESGLFVSKIDVTLLWFTDCDSQRETPANTSQFNTPPQCESHNTFFSIRRVERLSVLFTNTLSKCALKCIPMLDLRRAHSDVGNL